MNLTPTPKNCDPSVKKAIQLLNNDLGPTSEPTFAGLTLTSLTANRLVYTDADSQLASVADLTAWIAGTTNQVNVADDSDGTVTLSTPQDIHTGATPQFAGLGIGTSGSTGKLYVVTGQEIPFYINAAGNNATGMWFHNSNDENSSNNISIDLTCIIETGDFVYSALKVTSGFDDVGHSTFSSLVEFKTYDTAVQVTALTIDGKNIDVLGSITAEKFISDVAIGTSPYACTSTTLNTNLNADLLDGQHASAFQAAGSYLSNVVEDTTPQLGGDLDGQSTYDLTNMVDGTFSGTVQAEQLTSTDDINATGDITCDYVLCKGFKYASNPTTYFGFLAAKQYFLQADTNVVFAYFDGASKNPQIHFNEYTGIKNDIDFYISSANVSNLFALDAGTDSIRLGDGGSTNYAKFSSTGNLFLYGTAIKSGATQAGAGAAAGEIWKTSSHASLPDNVLLIGV